MNIGIDLCRDWSGHWNRRFMGGSSVKLVVDEGVAW